MSFITNKYKPWTPVWFVQRVIVVLKEGRMPQLGHLFGFKPYKPREPVPAKKHNKIKKAPVELSMMEIHIPEEIRNANRINSYFDKIYLLNLKHRSDKRLKSIFQLKQMGINAWIVDGINGFEEPYLSRYEKYKAIPLGQKNAHPLEIKYQRKMISSPGGWGVLESKKLIFRHAMENNYNRILILQDDLFFIEDFHRKFEEFISIIDDDWKIMGLGATQHSWNVPTSLFYNDPNIREYDPGQKLYYPLNTDGAFALAYDRSVFPMILEEIEKMNCSFDSGAVREVYRNYRKKCYICQPNLIIADVSTSDIRGSRDQEEFSAKKRWHLELYDRQQYHDELVSVIMPAFNAENTIEKSIRSILQQSYRNLEIIVADDGSTDNTADVVQRIADEDSRVILIRNRENRGCYFVRNDALRQSKGRYIAIQDADDISLANRIEKQLIPLVSGNALIVAGHIIRSNKNIGFFNLENEARLLEIIRQDVTEDVSAGHDSAKKRIGLNTTMFHRKLFQEYGLFWENRFGSDSEIIERVMFKKAGIILEDSDQTIHGYFSKHRHLPEIYTIIDDVLLISPEMNNENLSNLYDIKGLARKEFREKYREVLLNQPGHHYPGF